MTTVTPGTDYLRLIEAGFPCHQVGAETQRERDTGKAPPTHRLHVWWARRPLTPSRAAILGATLPADADTDDFLRALGIEQRIAFLDGLPWILNSKDHTLLSRVTEDSRYLVVDAVVRRRIRAESERRTKSLELIQKLKVKHPQFANDPCLLRWEKESSEHLKEDIADGTSIPIERRPADPAYSKNRIALESVLGIRTSLDKYGYNRAYQQSGCSEKTSGLTVLDPTAGGGSIPFEALSLGHDVIANELNPVATVILHATLDYPRRFGRNLVGIIRQWGELFHRHMVDAISDTFVEGDILEAQKVELEEHLSRHADLVDHYIKEHLDGFIYCRQVTCPHCGGQAPLLNSFWLSKEDGDKWAVELTVRRKSQVDLEPYRLTGIISSNLSKQLDAGTIDAGRGTCLHCQQQIDADEIKAQARGESPHGKMEDRLFCVVAFRYQPKLKKDGAVDRYASGERKGQIKTEKVSFFRAPVKRDFDALELAQQRLAEQWDHFEKLDLIPTEHIPAGHKTGNEGGTGSGTDKPLKLGYTRWCDLFTPRQLLGHLTLMEGLQNLKPQILNDLGHERGKAVITYLQFAIDKGLDYNSRQTRWEYTRGVVKGTFSRHDFSFKWTFGEMVFTGPNSGAAWGLSQILDAYTGLTELTVGVPANLRCRILNGSASQMTEIPDESVDLVVNDPPYYNNVMYSELADFYYVWEKRSLRDLYPGLLDSYLTDKESETVANPHRDGSPRGAKGQYEMLMREMYTECARVTKPVGRMVLMFTHKSQEGWETLTQALIDSGWIITATYPVESESGHSMHIMENASAESSIFIVCRKREQDGEEPGLWQAFGGQGVQQRIVDEVRQGLDEFEALKLRPVDTMVASYGRALRVLSEKWPVLDGDEPVSPIRAMNEASRVVAQNHIRKLTEGRLKVEDLVPEAAMAVVLYGICGLGGIRFDEVLNISKSLNMSLQPRTSGYMAQGQSIGYGAEAAGRRAGRQRRGYDIVGYHAPLVRRNSDLRLAKPEERHASRISSPQHEWDVLQGMILKYREGDVPVARAYLNEHADGQQTKILDLLRVWTNEADDEKLQHEGEMMLFGLN